MECPKCPGVSLREVDAAAGEIPAGRCPWLCSQCGGLWMPQSTALQLAAEDFELQPLLLDSSELYHRRDAHAGRCPLGHGALVRAELNDGESYSVERCLRCRGMWFDNGEWDRLRSSETRDRVLDFWLDEGQREQILTLQGDSLRQALRQTFGDALAGELERVARALRGHAQRQLALTYLSEQSEGPEDAD